MTPWQLRLALHTVRAGGVIAYPTEAVYGLGCDPLCHDAVLRILALKQRPMAKGLILIASDPTQLSDYLLPLTDSERRRVMDTWPGPVTWLIPARPEVPRWLRGDHDTLAVRVTDHPVARAMCAELGHPIVSTSANPGGRSPARSALQVHRYFGTQIDLTLAGRLGQQARPTTIRDLSSGAVVRPG